MKKKLIDLLNEKKYQKVNVKIGSKSGSSFWYCGKGNTNYSLYEIKKAREKTLRQSKGALKQAQYRLENLDMIYATNIEKVIKKGTIKDIEAYRKKMHTTLEKERLLLPKKIASLEYDVAIPLLERPVLEIVEGISPDEKPCYVIYVKGNEKGEYWTIAEYNKRKKLLQNVQVN